VNLFGGLPAKLELNIDTT